MAHDWVWALVWPVASALLSLLVGERSRVDAWCEAHPRVAGGIKLLRAMGVDPWLIVSATSLIVNKKLPAPKEHKEESEPK